MERLLITIAGVILVAMFAWAIVATCDEVREEHCMEAQLDIIANQYCHDNLQCMLTGADYRSMVRQQHYVKENCKDERKASEVPEKATEPEEADPGLSVWSGANEK